MHLFLFDLFVSIDILCPVINQLNPKKIIICNINSIQNYKKNHLVSSLLKKNIQYYDYLPISNKFFFLYFLLKIVLLLPSKILKKMRFVWILIYKKFFFSSEKDIEKFIQSNYIKTISYEESSPKFIVEIFYKIAKKKNIKVIKIASGLSTGKINRIGKKKLNFCDYYISPNKIRGEKKNQNFKHQIKYFGSLRFSSNWIKKLNKINGYRVKTKKKINIGFFTKFFSRERSSVEQVIAKLKDNPNYQIKTREKPRDISPLKCSKSYKDDMNTSLLINWSDVIITARSSSMIIEAIICKKKVILLEYLNKKIKKSKIYNYSFILKAKKFDDLDNLINKKKINSNKQNILINKFLINFNYFKKIKSDYINFYKGLL